MLVSKPTVVLLDPRARFTLLLEEIAKDTKLINQFKDDFVLFLRSKGINLVDKVEIPQVVITVAKSEKSSQTDQPPVSASVVTQAVKQSLPTAPTQPIIQTQPVVERVNHVDAQEEEEEEDEEMLHKQLSMEFDMKFNCSDLLVVQEVAKVEQLEEEDEEEEEETEQEELETEQEEQETEQEEQEETEQDAEEDTEETEPEPKYQILKLSFTYATQIVN